MCEVVLNYVEVGAIALCVVVSVVLWCSDTLESCLRVATLRFVLMLCICYVSVCCVDTTDGMLYCFFVALC